MRPFLTGVFLLTYNIMGTNKFSVKYCVLLPLVLLITIFLLAVPTSFFGIEGLTVLQQRTIALFVFAALMWIFEIIPSWTTSVMIIVFVISGWGPRDFPVGPT